LRASLARWPRCGVLGMSVGAPTRGLHWRV
jgi:hypothetical protein